MKKIIVAMLLMAMSGSVFAAATPMHAAIAISARQTENERFIALVNGKSYAFSSKAELTAWLATILSDYTAKVNAIGVTPSEEE